MSNAADADHDLTIAIGEAASTETNPVLMKLASSLTKRFDATWAVGDAAGGMQASSSLPTNGTCHVYLMERSDTGVVDAMAVPNGTTLVLPSGYDRSRRIGSFVTDSSANIRGFRQNGDRFSLNSAVVSLNTSSAISNALLTLAVPAGLKVVPMLYCLLYHSSALQADILAGPGDSSAVSGTLFYILGSNQIIAAHGTADWAWTNTSAQIRYSITIYGGGLTNAIIHTQGWIDTRGRDA
jgi:hypothetical protein